MKKRFVIGFLFSILFGFVVVTTTACGGGGNKPSTNQSKEMYTVTWLNDDESVLETKEVEAGTIAKYSGTTPVSKRLKNDKFHSNVFSGWMVGGAFIEPNESYEVHSEVRLIASYREVQTTFKFEFKDYDGKVLQTVEGSYQYNVMDQVNVNPKRPKDGNKEYQFTGWDIDIEKFWQTDYENYIDFGKVKTVNAVYAEINPSLSTDGLVYEYVDEDDIYIVNKYEGTSKNVVIGATYNNKPVVGINTSAFANTEVETIYIAEGIKRIAMMAFETCPNLKSVRIPNSIEYVGSSLFSYSPFNNYKIDGGLKYIGNDENPYLVLLKPDDNSEGKTFTINEDTKVLANDVFYDRTNLESITIPENITKIPELCFSRCSSLKSVTFEGDITEIGHNAFAQCTSIEGITLPDTVTSIDYFAFAGCTSLKTIYIPEGVEILRMGIFEGCTNLENVSIPSSLKTIEGDVFADCTKVTGTLINNCYYLGNTNNPYVYLISIVGDSEHNITLSKNTKVVNDNAYSCGDINNIYFDGDFADWFNFSKLLSIARANAVYFNDVKVEGEVILPDTVTEIPAYSFGLFKDVTKVTIPNTVTEIGIGAFRNATSLKEVVIAEGITEIPEYGFSSCESLDTITLPSTLTKIGKDAFSNCKKLEEITIPKNVEEIGNYGFYNCEILKTVVFEEGSKCTKIGQIAFADDVMLESINLPSGLKKIEYMLFNRCTALTNVIVPDGVEEIESNVLVLSGVKKLLLPKSVKKIGEKAIYSSDAIIYYTGIDNEFNEIEIGSNNVLAGVEYVLDLSTLANEIINSNYTLKLSSKNYDIYGDVIRSSGIIYKKNDNDTYTGYEMSTTGNKITFTETADQLPNDVIYYKNLLKDFFDGEDYKYSFINDKLAYEIVGNRNMNGTLLKNRKIVFEGNQLYTVSYDDGDNIHEFGVSNIGKLLVEEPTDNEIDLYFMGIKYFGDFTQTNTVVMDMNGTNITTTNMYKLDRLNIYVSQSTDYPQVQTQGYYLSFENDKYYAYQEASPNNWVKQQITRAQYEEGMADGLDSDTRALLFDGKNYTKSGNTYNYTGDDVYFSQSGTDIKYDDITLTIEDGTLTISFTIANGYITGTYVFSNVNTTTVTLPNV